MLKRNLISPQYLKSDKISISIIEMKNPVHFVIKEDQSTKASTEVMKFIEVEEIMQNYYRSVEPSLYQLPLKDEIVVVKVEKKFFRAMVCSILNKTDGYIFKVYLLDYGKYCTVPRLHLYEISRDFLQHPFQAVDFKLCDIEPASLVMNSTDMTFSYGKVDSWDPSAVSFMEMILKALNQAYIVVKGVEKNCLVGSLIVTLCNGEVKCINDELINKKFAHPSPDGMEKVMKLNTYIQNQVKTSGSSKAQLAVESSSESVISVCSADGAKNMRHNLVKESEKANSVSDSKEPIRRKMIDRIAVDINELHRENIECSSHNVQNNVPNTSSKLQNLLKYQSIASSTSSVHSSCSPEKQNNSKSTVSSSSIKEERAESLKSAKIINANEKIGRCSSKTSPITMKNNLNENTVNPSSTSQTQPIKVEHIKNFLHTRKKSLTTKPKSSHEEEIRPKPKLFSEKSSDTSSSISNAQIKSELNKCVMPKDTIATKVDPLGNFTEGDMSDTDDPDDLLQCALDPNKKIISSDTDSASPVKSRLEPRNQIEISLDFSKKSLWEKQEVPALCVGDAVTLPVLSVDKMSFSPYVKKVLEDLNFYGPSSIQSVVWPSMSRYRNLAAIAPPHSGKTIAYLLPLISNITDGAPYNNIPKGKSPIAIIICSSWKKVQAVHDYFRIFGDTSKIKMITLFVDGKSKRTKISALASGCDVVVSVPTCFLEVLKDKVIDFSRCCHFILDDGNTLLSHQLEQVTEIMLTLNDRVKSRNINLIQFQILICAERWTKSVSSFVDKFMITPMLFFTSFLESAIYAQVPIFGHFCSMNKNKKLLEILQNTRKTVICTSKKESAMDIHSFLKCENIRSYLVLEDMEHYISKGVIQDWKSIQSSLTPYCLIITDAALIDMPVSDANYLVHYDVPEVSRLQFGNRFSCIAETFSSPDKKPDSIVHVLITEDCSNQAAALLKIIHRSGGKVSKELKLFSKKQHNALKNAEALLCHYFKAYGFCNQSNCNLRHHVNPDLDKSIFDLNDGDVQCLVTHVFDASHYYVRLLKHVRPSGNKSNKCISFSGTYAKIGFQLRSIYSENKNKKKVNSTISINDNYILEEENKLFFRVKILNIIESKNNALQYVLGFQDEGWVKNYSDCNLLYPVNNIDLPPPVAAEVYLCGVLPPDSCLDWNYQATHFIENMIYNQEVHGKIALCLGDTLWLNPIMLREKLLFVNDYLNLMTLSKALKKRGFALENVPHLPRLRNACEGKVIIPNIQDAPPPVTENIELFDVSHTFLELNVVEDIYVSAITTPYQFYVQRAKFVDCLDELLDKINDFKQKKLLKKCQTLQKGLHCIAPFIEDNRYYRAVVLDVISERDEVQLFYVDFGDIGCIKCNMVYAMQSEFLLLPFQAIECELDGIRPAHGGWSDSTINSLYDLTRNNDGDMKILQLQAFSKTFSYTGGNHYIVDMWSEEKSLSDQLLETGLVESKIRIAESVISSIDEKKEEYWDDIPPGYATSTSEELSSDEKDNNALFCAVLAKMMLVGDKPSKEEDEAVTEILKNVDFSKPDKATNNFRNRCEKVKGPETVKPVNINKKISPLKNLQKMLRESTKSQRKCLKPQIMWWDTTEQVNLKIIVKNLKIYELDLHDLGFNFRTSTSNIEYHAEETFFSQVTSEKSETNIVSEGLYITVAKKKSIKWPRLLQSNLKSPHIKYDLNHIDDSDSEELVDETLGKGKVEAVPYYSDEEFEDKEFSDNEDICVKPWKQLAEFVDPFSPVP